MKTKSHFISRIAYITLFVFPAVSFAALDGVNELLTSFGGLVGKAIPIVVALALLFFFYGVALYIFRAGDEKQAKEGKSIMIYGVIALFVMFSIFGLIQAIGANLNITNPSSGPGLNGNDLFGTNANNG